MRSSTPVGAAARAARPELAVAAEIGAALTAATTLADLLGTLRRRLKWLLPAGGRWRVVPRADRRRG